MTKKALLLFGFIALKFILHYFLISPEYDLHRDEYLHLDQGRHLDWGYISVPPFTAWVSKLILLLGNSVFWVKFFPALFGALTIYIVWKTIESLNGSLFSLILGSVCILFSAILRLNILYQPNSFDVLSWVTFYYIVIRYIQTQKSKWLFIGAFAFALGFLNKYNIIFLLIGLLPVFLLTKHRVVLSKKQLCWSLLLAILVVTPNLLWQYNNHFPVVHHLKELAATQLVNVDRFDFLKHQLLFFIGSFFVIISGLVGLLCYKPFKPYRLFFFSFFLTLFVFMYFKAKDYYAIGLYPIYIAFGAVVLGEWLKTGWKKYLQPVTIALPLLLFIPVYNIAFPNKSPNYILEHPEPYKKFGLLRWEDGKDHTLPQDFADMQGWKELAQKVDSVYTKIPDPQHTLILCDNYGQAGAINYYTQQKIQAVSFNADYINWFDLTQKHKNLIRIKEADGSQTELKETSPFFTTASIAGTITNPNAREFGTTIFVFTGAKMDINGRIKVEIKQYKDYLKE
ncbi:glycosyltransferase family 39 protein [Flavobacterium phycosphaerae]|uniref:glycosyltransferase family 39 protein n=1 Tax=Flavobacterium phycosphaerae TaxID=2697515 RepID=UPI00138A5DA1|nr:glycosyltransferase family 39 protein [Flavobacterium phycosphaerae]